MTMKRKVLIAAGAVYVLLIAVILIFALTGTKPSAASVSDAETQPADQADDTLITADPVTEIPANGSEFEAGDADTEESIAGEMYPLSTAYSPPGEDETYPAGDENGYPLATQTRQSGAVLTTRTPTRTLTRTATQPGASPSATRTPTRTPTTPVTTGWAGDWTVYVGPEGGPYASGSLSITIDGDNVSASAVIQGENYDFSGTLISNELYIQGDYAKSGTPGWFSWTFITDGQFGGTLDNRQAFCAARAGFGKPEPCGYFVLS